MRDFASSCVLFGETHIPYVIVTILAVILYMFDRLLRTIMKRMPLAAAFANKSLPVLLILFLVIFYLFNIRQNPYKVNPPTTHTRTAPQPSTPIL